MTGESSSAVLARIEKELRDVWLTPEPEGSSIPPKSRVCTMNLVVAGSGELMERYTQVVDEVTASIPARAIMVALDPEAEASELGGDATAVCSVLGGKNICSERVRLVARGGVCTRVASVVDALLVPEIPTALVWLGRVHATDPVFLSLSASCERIITDSEYTSLSSLLHLAAWARKDTCHASIADLAWTRLAPWQELFARFFDDPRLRGHASRITRLTVRQASEPGARLGSEGALLLGWIATRLGWRTSRLGGALRFQRPDGKNVAIDFGVTPRPEGTAPSALAMIRLEAEHDDVHVEGVIERELASGLSSDALDADMVNWTLRVGAAPAIEQRVRFGANKAAKWLERTLHRPARDPALAESVAFAEEVLEDGVVCGAPNHPR